MQRDISKEFLDAISRTDKRVLELFEFYTPDEEAYEPENAVRRYAQTTYYFKGFVYKRQVLSRGNARRFLERDSNTVNVEFSTVSAEMSQFIMSQRVEGMWLQIRRVSLDIPDESQVIFGGRCEKPDDKFGVITVKQEIGGGDEQIPRKVYAPRCQVGRFKNEACRGGIPVSAHTPAYQAATSCNYTFNQCDSYGNTDNIQMIRFVAQSGNFNYTTIETKRFLFFFSRKKKRVVSAPWSSVSDAADDTVIPEIAGVVQTELVPVMHADTGALLRTLQIVCDGHIEEIFNVAQKEKKYLPVLQNYQQALGVFGSQGQPSSALFLGAGKFSGMSWVEYALAGSDPTDANDESPSTVAIVRGRKMPLPDATGAFNSIGWTDSGPVMLRYYLSEMGRHPLSQIEDESVLEAFFDCNEPVIDDTGFEQAIVPQQLTGGVDFKLWASVSGFGAATVDRVALLLAQGKPITGGYGQMVQAYYRYINQTQPNQFVSVVRKVRRRYTTNFVLKEQMRLRDFIYDILLPSFNGYLIFNAKGQIRVKVDKPALTTYLLSSTSVGASSVEVEDITAWKLAIGKQILIGAHLKNSEVRRVVDWSFSGFGNAIALTAAATGGMTATASSATLTGGGGVTPAKATVTLTGTPGAGDTITLGIDGVPIVHTSQAGDDREATAGLLAATINGHPVLKRYRHQEKEFHHEEHEEHEESKEKPLNLSLPLFVLFVSSWFYFLEVYTSAWNGIWRKAPSSRSFAKRAI